MISPSQRPLRKNTHNTHKRQTSMLPAGFEPEIPASERPWTRALDRSAAGIGFNLVYHYVISHLTRRHRIHRLGTASAGLRPSLLLFCCRVHAFAPVSLLNYFFLFARNFKQVLMEFLMYFSTYSLCISVHIPTKQTNNKFSITVAQYSRSDKRGVTFDSWQRQKIFLVSIGSRPVLRPIESLTSWVPRVNRPGYEADHSRQFNTEVKIDSPMPLLPQYVFVTRRETNLPVPFKRQFNCSQPCSNSVHIRISRYSDNYADHGRG